MRFSHERERGFTLVEVIIVAGMVAVLATVVFTNISEARKRARDIQRESDLAQLQIALKLYNDVYGTYNVENLVSGGEGVTWVSQGHSDSGADDQRGQLIGSEEIELPGGSGDDTKGSTIDQALYLKGYLPSPVLQDPQLSSRSDRGYMIALCDEGRRYAVYATKELPDEGEIASTVGLCDGEDGSSGKQNAVVRDYGKNYGVGN
jgi:prepilin-type N-terminal cleavage/methylation domain-containing protein